MYLAAIFATFLLAMHPGRDTACRVSGGEQEQTAQAQKPPEKEAAPSSANSAEQKQSEGKPDAAQPDKKETPSRDKPANPPANVVNKRRVRSKKPIPLPNANGEPRKIVVHHGGASEPVTQIVPGVTPEEAVNQRESAEQLLAASESSLERLAGRSLKPRQQGMVVQIRQYIDGARSALKESDTQRAHTLAMKAYLLADDLVKH